MPRAPAEDAEATGNQSDGAYEDSGLADAAGEDAGGSDRKVKQQASDPLSMEETKTYEEFKEKVMEQPFYGSDEEAYIEDDDQDGEDGQYEDDRDDFSLSDTGAQEHEFCEDIEIDDLDDEEERER